MPRNQNPGNLALRNRNRVTNKTRLKVIKGNIDADPIVLDEDEERARVVSTAGVDAEDANEHHLQAVLSAASHRATSLGQKATRAAFEKAGKRIETPTAFIPVPDAAGVVDNYAELYPPGQWTEPSTYVKFSDTVDECIRTALADGFTYIMDERDKEWLDRNNQEARGEGTSAQGSVAASGTTTRSGALHRSAKSKGKEPEPSSPVYISEDDFELVMGVFEKLTHDNTPFLHVSLEQGMSVPPFSNYQDVFASELPPSMFATFMTPLDISPPSTLSRVARVVYPYWRDRRVEREGHRIIPTLNFDESDTKNESYICFRRREIKAIRKTRTTQVTSSDKLLRLKGELAASLELAQHVLMRENQKRDAIYEAQQVWEKRCALVDLKRKSFTLGGKEDEELLVDKDRVPKKPRIGETPSAQVLRIKNRPGSDMSSPTPTEPHMRPRDRTNMIQNMIEEHMKRQKERDHLWDDQIDNPYQARPIAAAERAFKSIAPIAQFTAPSARSREPSSRAATHLRLRVGRGGRMHVDRRTHIVRSKHVLEDYLQYQPSFPRRLEGLNKAELDEQAWRVSDRWKYDADAQSGTPDVGADEEDRILLDDFQPRFLRYSMQLLQEHDHGCIATDPRLYLPDGHNGITMVLPFRASAISQTARREPQALQRPSLAHAVPQPLSAQQQVGNISQHSSSSSSGVPVSMQTPVRKMQPPAAAQHIRIPPTGALRPPVVLPGMQVGAIITNQSPSTIPSASAVSAGSNSVGNLTHGGVNSGLAKSAFTGQPNGTVQTGNGQGSHAAHESTSVPGRVSSPVRPQSQIQHHPSSQQMVMSNGFPNGMPNGSFNGFPNSVPNGYANHSASQHNVLSMQQAQNLKVAFAGIPPSQGIPMQPSLPATASVPPRPPSAYAQHISSGVNGTTVNNINMMGATNMNLKMPANRQMQWAAATQRQQPVPIGTDAMHSPNLSHTSPIGMIRAPSANGHHLSPPTRSGHSPSSHLIGQGQDRGSPINHHLISHSLPPHMGNPSQSHSSPPRIMQAPVPPVPSPSLQHQQIVGGPLHQGSGY